MFFARRDGKVPQQFAREQIMIRMKVALAHRDELQGVIKQFLFIG